MIFLLEPFGQLMNKERSCNRFFCEASNSWIRFLFSSFFWVGGRGRAGGEGVGEGEGRGLGKGGRGEEGERASVRLSDKFLRIVKINDSYRYFVSHGHFDFFFFFFLFLGDVDLTSNDNIRVKELD